MLHDLLPVLRENLRIILSFAIIALAAGQIGRYFVKGRLPLISGFLFAGILAGPFVLGLISKESVKQLRFIDEAALAIIAFAAGNELYLKELRSRLKSIAWITTGLVLMTFTLGSVTVVLLADHIPFMREMPTAARIAVGILAGAILVARSPSSAIAIVKELRAKGPFTQTALGVTVIMDVIVIIVFAINSEIANALLNDVGFSVGFLALVLAQVGLSLLLGWGLAKLIGLLLWTSFSSRIKSIVLLGLGYGVFQISSALRHWSENHLNFELLLEPLLICMVASFVITNRSRYRDELSDILHTLGPPIYIAFFTLTGALLALDILLTVWPIALVLFGVGLVGIFLGSFTGGTVAGDPVKHNRIAWMAYITQAGVGLGLAKEVVVEFGEIGNSFATLIIAVIVINQLVGPPLLKLAIGLVGESHLKGPGTEADGARDVVIFGLNARAMAVAKQLRAYDYHVRIATLEEATAEVREQAFEIVRLESWSPNELHKLDLKKANAVVTMLKDDANNYQICETVFERYGIETMVVQLRDRENRGHFSDIGVLLVEPETAVVTLIEQFVRSPSGASLLLGMEAGHDIIDIELTNPTYHGVAIRDLSLPLDVLVLSIHRDNQPLVSKGHTQLRRGDRLTVVGPEEMLEEVMLKLEA